MFWGAQKKRLTPDEIYPPRLRVRRPDSISWELSILLGKAGVAIMFAVTLSLLFGGRLAIGEHLARLVPPEIVRFFNQPAPAEEPGEIRDIRETVSDALKANAGTATAHAAERGFVQRGMTKEQVRSVQGQPTSMSGEVWYYGTSRIYFSGNRVINWQSNPATPLRVR